jgi:hypothetical protein
MMNQIIRLMTALISQTMAKPMDVSPLREQGF